MRFLEVWWKWFKDFDDDFIVFSVFIILKLYNLNEFMYYMNYFLIKLYIKEENVNIVYICRCLDYVEK